MRGLLVCVLGYFCVSNISGQTRAAVGVASQGGGTFTIPAMPYKTPAVTGAPYSAEQIQERVQTLADGTHINQDFGMQRVWRDSQGRTRMERPVSMAPRPNAPPAPSVVEIRDPVAGYAYILDTQAKVAHRITLQPMPDRLTAAGPANALLPLPPPPPPPPAGGSAGSAATAVFAPGVGAPRAGAADDPNRPQHSAENLGTQVIEGVQAEGRRVTTTYPAGSQGNDRPIVVTSESWYSPELRQTILAKTSDPRSGESTMKWTNINRSEPDAILFTAPADYTLVEETEPRVTIHYTLPPQ